VIYELEYKEKSENVKQKIKERDHLAELIKTE
jgi:hypothetical protein